MQKWKIGQRVRLTDEYIDLLRKTSKFFGKEFDETRDRGEIIEIQGVYYTIKCEDDHLMKVKGYLIELDKNYYREKRFGKLLDDEEI